MRAFPSFVKRSLADTFLQIDRDIYLANVLRQAVERHFLRHIADIVPRQLTPEEIAKLTRADGAKEARRREVELEMDVLRKSLSALEDIQ